MFRRFALSAVLTVSALPGTAWACPSIGPIEIAVMTVISSAILSVIVSAPVFMVFSFVARRLSRKAPSLNKVFFCFFFILLAPVAFLLSDSGGSYPRAEGSNIISELRNMRAATMMYLADYPGSADSEATATNLVGLIAPYMGNPDKMDPERYALHIGSPYTCWVGYRTDTLEDDARGKLAARAKGVGLYGSPRFDMPPLSIHDRRYAESDGAVWMPLDVEYAKNLRLSSSNPPQRDAPVSADPCRALLMAAIREDSGDLVAELTASGLDLETPAPSDIWQTQWETPLAGAIRQNRKALAEILLNAGADANTPSGYSSDTPLGLAVEAEDCGIVDLLLDRGASPDARSGRNQRAPLYTAILASNDSAIRILLSSGAEIDARNANGETPLFAAAAAGDSDTADRLIAEGADPDAADDLGYSPLFRAMLAGHAELAKKLIDLGADVQRRCDEGFTLLDWAAWHGDAKTIKLLLASGADPAEPGPEGWTPLHRAVWGGDIRSVKILIEAGSNIDAPTEQNGTPLDMALSFDRKDIAQYLKSLGAHQGTERNAATDKVRQ